MIEMWSAEISANHAVPHSLRLPLVDTRTIDNEYEVLHHPGVHDLVGTFDTTYKDEELYEIGLKQGSKP